MSNIVLLDKQKHRQLKIKTGHGKAFGENIHFVPVVAQELSELAKEYPVCFLKDDQSGQFGLFALLGFEAGQNCFLQNGQWQSRYLPLHFQRQPFLLPADKQQVYIDLASAKICSDEEEGVLLFGDDGEPSDYLKQTVSQLKLLAEGRVQTNKMIKELLALDLIEAAQVNFIDNTGAVKQYEGIYRLSEDRLQALDVADRESLFKKGYLEAFYLLKQSLTNLNQLC
ncbi:SapC family protein [Gayadomonas joobiniege]|uniref:SapC family protein n=1 Tax=Gayadomonas joobiniege TaxID=1234606 RepID=UPI00036958F0|nr:SapC family protein [Gayadomonas joobiniege]